MGCDIHLHVEIKVGGEWLHYNHPDIDRDYGLFAQMAGVRNRDGIEPIAQPRGLPADATRTTQLDSQEREGDGHSHSWLSSLEVERLIAWYLTYPRATPNAWWDFADQFGWLFGNNLSGLHKHPRDYPPWLEDFRFVFWFDN